MVKGSVMESPFSPPLLWGNSYFTYLRNPIGKHVLNRCKEGETL